MMNTKSVGTGVPRNSPIVKPLEPNGGSYRGGGGGIGGLHPELEDNIGHGILDLSAINSSYTPIKGTFRGASGGFVSTAVEGGVTPRGGSASSSTTPRKKERSPASNAHANRVDVHNNEDLQMRFAASVMPSGRRQIQPLPDFLDSNYGFRPVVGGGGQPRATSLLDEIGGGNSNNTLSTSHQQHQHQQRGDISIETATSMNNNNNSHVTASPSSGARIHDDHRHHHHHHPFSPSPVPQQQQQQYATTATMSVANVDGRVVTASSASAAREHSHVSERLYSSTSVSLREGLHELVSVKKQQRSSSAASNNNNTNRSARGTSSAGLPSARRAGGSASSASKQRTGRANRVTCCPEDQARGGHLAKGIVIGSCERQAMERYLQVARELELEREARASDKWKHELELVKTLNKCEELDREVTKLRASADNPKTIADLKMLRDEYESRWKTAQAKLEERNQEKVKLEVEKEALELRVLQKDHECEGLRSAVERMEKKDNEHEEVLSDLRKKLYEERSQRESCERRIAELEAAVKNMDNKCKSYRSAVKGLEAQLALQRRKDKALGGKSPRGFGGGGGFSSSSPLPGGAEDAMSFSAALGASPGMTPQGPARNALTTLRSAVHAPSVQVSDLDTAVNTLMSLYQQSPSGSPERIRGGGGGGGGRGSSLMSGRRSGSIPHRSSSTNKNQFQTPGRGAGGSPGRSAVALSPRPDPAGSAVAKVETMHGF